MELHALVIEPDACQRELVRAVLLADKWRVATATSVWAAMKDTCDYPWALVFCSVGEKEQPLALLSELKNKLGLAVPIILMVAHLNTATMLAALLNGAADLLHQPSQAAEIQACARFVTARKRAAARETITNRPTQMMPESEEHKGNVFALIGQSEAFRAITTSLAKALRQEQTDASFRALPQTWQRSPTFFLTGETGTGKELVARAIHQHSRYHAGPFVAVNCSNLSAELADAELFGYCPGAFTGALKQTQVGLWETAAGGTLLLDEMTEAPDAVLPKLLRVLQSGEFTRLGAQRVTTVDVQVVAATNRDLPTEIKAGRFRADLYHRLSLYTFHLPPLRERQADIPLLAAHFARLYSGGRVKITQEALALLSEFSRLYPWPGNIRELENVLRRAVKHVPDDTIYGVDLAEHLPQADSQAPSLPIAPAVRHEVAEKSAAVYQDQQAGAGLDERVKRFKLEVVRAALTAHQGNRTRAANTLDVSRAKLHRILKELDRKSEKS